MLAQGFRVSSAERSVVFVAPFLAATTVRFVQSVASLPGVRLGLVTQDPAERIPPDLRALLAGHRQIDQGLHPAAIADGVQALAARLGRPERLLGTLEQLQVPLAEVRQVLGIPGLGVEEAKNFRDKSRMKQVLRQSGIPCARHALATDSTQALGRAEEIGFPLVVKPPAGAAAANTQRVDDPGQLRDYMRLVRPGPSAPLLLEEFVVGEEHSFDAVTVSGRPVWHSLTHYRPGPLEVLRNPWIQWTVLLPREVDHPRYDDVRAVGVKTLRVLGMQSGLSHMEWFRRPDGSIAVSEIAARPPGAQFTTLISYAHDLDFYRAWAEVVVFDRFDPPQRRYAAGIAYLRGQGRGRVSKIHGLERAQKEMGGLVVEVRLPRPGQQPADSYEGEGYVVLRHPQTRVVDEALQRLVSSVRVELA